jgi:integrase
MAVYKDGDKWRVIYRYTNWKGERKQTQKRGFATKREALAWEREVMLKCESKLDMTFASFYEIYEADRKKRLKENTWESKSYVIRTKILPYFGERKISEIEPKDVIAWQNELISHKDENGEAYSPTYLKTIHSQLSAIFNHAVRFYHLQYNPAQRAGTMGSEEHKEMLFWTKEEYLKFADVMMDKPVSYYAFEMLYDVDEEERIFMITKSYLHHEMDRGAKKSGVKRIRIHDLRHSAISLLIEMGFSALAIAERVGHESIDITYRYAHLFPTKQTEMADKLDIERMGEEKEGLA